MMRMSLSRLAKDQDGVARSLNEGKQFLVTTDEGRPLGVLSHPDRQVLLEEVATLASNPRTLAAFVNDKGSGRAVPWQEVFGYGEARVHEPDRSY